MIDVFGDINSKLDALSKSAVKVKVGTVTSISPFKCRFDGETTELQYLKPKNYTPIAGDRVYFLLVDGVYICLGAYN